MHNDYAELLRVTLNLIRVGKIADVDFDAQKVRVKIGRNLTNWRPWSVQRAGDDQIWWPPSIDEQVIVFSPNGDFNQSIIFMAAYSDAGPAPSSDPQLHTTKYADGAVIQYDKKTHALTATLPTGSSAFVKADQVTADAKETICTGNLTVGKNLTVNGKSTLKNDAIISGISFASHKHGGIQPGGGSTGAPA